MSHPSRRISVPLTRAQERKLGPMIVRGRSGGVWMILAQVRIKGKYRTSHIACVLVQRDACRAVLAAAEANGLRKKEPRTTPEGT